MDMNDVRLLRYHKKRAKLVRLMGEVLGLSPEAILDSLPKSRGTKAVILDGHAVEVEDSSEYDQWIELTKEELTLIVGCSWKTLVSSFWDVAKDDPVVMALYRHDVLGEGVI